MPTHLVFRSKVLEAHHYNTYGEDATSSDSSTSGYEGATGGVSTPSEHSSRLDDSPQEEAIGVLKKHKQFLHKERLLAESYRKIISQLPRSVSSRREVEDGPASGGGEERKEPQTQKNRKRKLKKRKAKEKRFKSMESTSSKDDTSH